MSLPPHRPAPRPARGRPVDFDDLHRTSFAGMVRLAWLLVGSRPAAEEVVHDAFLDVRRRWGSVDDPGEALRRAVVLGAARARRRPGPRRRGGAERAPAAVGEPPPTGDPEVDSMWDAVDRLRPDRRTVVVLHHWADLSPAEIAEVLGQPAPTVRARLHRARSDLRSWGSR